MRLQEHLVLGKAFERCSGWKAVQLSYTTIRLAESSPVVRNKGNSLDYRKMDTDPF